MTATAIAASFSQQARWCEAIGSDLYATLLDVAAADIIDGGPVAGIVDGFADDPIAAALALRFMGGVHRLVLMDLADALARHYPSVGGHPDADTLVDDFLATVGQHHGYLRASLDIAPQTNEVGRCAVLFPAIAAALGGRRLRVRLLEVGSAAGLNLLMGEFRYDADAWTWGNRSAPVALSPEWRGVAPAVPRRVDIVERSGCDLAPIDVTDAEARLRMLSFIWPDQDERLHRARNALAMAEQDPPLVQRADAGEWVAERLANPTARRTMTVVEHSLVWQYLPEGTRRALSDAIEAAGAVATSTRPLAHVTFEPVRDWRAGSGLEVRVRTWPGGEDRIVATAHAHGAWVDWSG